MGTNAKLILNFMARCNLIDTSRDLLHVICLHRVSCWTRDDSNDYVNHWHWYRNIGFTSLSLIWFWFALTCMNVLSCIFQFTISRRRTFRELTLSTINKSFHLFESVWSYCAYTWRNNEKSSKSPTDVPFWSEHTIQALKAYVNCTAYLARTIMNWPS